MVKRKNQNDKQWSTKHNTENKRLSNTNFTNNLGLTNVLRKDKLFLLHLLYSSCRTSFDMEIVLDTKSKISEKTQEPQNLALRFQNQVGGHPPFPLSFFQNFLLLLLFYLSILTIFLISETLSVDPSPFSYVLSREVWMHVFKIIMSTYLL
jgi:hypothetical protein